MINEEFQKILNDRLCKIKTTLDKKAGEYSSDEDRLYNFKQAAAIMGVEPQEALWGMAVKHLVSVQDLVYKNLENTKANVNEKIGDLINYLILLEALLSEEREESQIL